MPKKTSREPEPTIELINGDRVPLGAAVACYKLVERCRAHDRPVFDALAAAAGFKSATAAVREVLKGEALAKTFPRHDPSPLSWRTFTSKLIALLTDSKSAPEADVGIKSDVVCERRCGATVVVSGLTIETANGLAGQFITSIPAAPAELSGKGIVICAGGSQYNTCAWILIRILRQLQCRLPIEVWCYDHELDAAWKDLVQPYGVSVRTIGTPRPDLPARWSGWQLKAASLLRSAFREILLLDADIVPLRDPSYLFETPEYLSAGTLFWPDKSRTPRKSDVWRAFGVPFSDEPNQESGQIVIDKARCWTALNLCGWYNVNAEFFYRFVYGDKDTFRLAWKRTNTPFRMPNKGVEPRNRYLLQHDFIGDPLFQHCVHSKWSLARTVHLPGLQHQEECLKLLEELRSAWVPARRAPKPLNNADVAWTSRLSEREWRLLLVGTAAWPVFLSTDGLVSRGQTAKIATWWIREGDLYLGTSDGEPRYRLGYVAENAWRGKSVSNDRQCVELVR